MVAWWNKAFREGDLLRGDKAVFPARRQRMVEKLKRTADALALELEDVMQKDFLEATQNPESFVKFFSKPCQDLAQRRLDDHLKTKN